MGLVYRAYDSAVKRDVALKTLRDAPNRAALQLFYKECEVLAALSHPNIIEIFDIGEYIEGDVAKPFFVMPLLPGATLDRLIAGSSHRLTVERVTEMICQACRGLHAAHERGLIHRDIKPSNLFVMDDDSVKIIDFGVAHMVEAGLSVGAKGTLLYMAPEQLQMKPATPASDVYSLGVVCYETLTRRRPFDAPSENEIVDAVLHRIPPAVCELNPAVSQTMSRVIHKAMAKQPWHRYASAREFSETMQKGMRNEPIEFFSAARIQPRIDRAAKAFEQGDHQFAVEILSELEAEGHIDPAISEIRRQVEYAARQKTIGQLLESARKRFEQDEYPLSLQKIQEVLQLDPGNAPALGLKASIENKLVNQKVEEWFRLAGQHIENQAYGHAREALRNLLELKPSETRAAKLLSEVDRLEQDYIKTRKMKEELYHQALECWNSGEVTSALTKLERVLAIDQESPDKSSPDRGAAYQNFYNKVRSEHETLKNSYSEARKHLADGNFAPALSLADAVLKKYPGHALFQALKFDIGEQQRQVASSRIAEIDRELDAEPDLDRRVHILEQAVAEWPGEPHFERQLKPMREKRDLVNSIAAKARYHEERGQFAEALAQWEILGTIYGQYPGLAFETERVVKRREQQLRSEAKARWLDQIDRTLEAGDHTRAGSLIASAEAEFPNDEEIAQVKRSLNQASENALEAKKLLAQGQSLCAQQLFDEGMATVRRALELDPRNPTIRAALLDLLVERARVLIDTDLPAAEPLIQQALEIDPAHALAKSLRTRLLDHKRDQAVIRCFMQARQYRASGELNKALAETEQCLAAYPFDPRLAQLRDILSKELEQSQVKKTRPADLAALRQLEQDALAAGEWADVKSVVERARAIATQYPGDPEFEAAVTGLEQRLTTMTSGRKSAPDSGMVSSFTAEMEKLKEAAPEPVTEEVAPPPAAFDWPPTETVPAQPPVPPVSAPPVAAPPEAVDLFGSAPPAPALPADDLFGGLPPTTEVPPVQPEAVQPVAAPPTVQPDVAPPPVQPPAPQPKPKAPMKPATKWAIIGGAGAFAVVLLAIVAFTMLPRKEAGTGTISFEVRTQPPGAVVRVDGKIRGTSNFPLAVEPGTYQLQATLDGYLPASTSITVTAGAAKPVELTLQPMPQTVRLFADVAEGKVTLDDQPSRELLEGQLMIESVVPGKHTVTIAARNSQASFEFELVPGGVPVITAPPAVKNVAALVVSSFGNRARIYSSVAPATAQMDSQPAGELRPEGLELSGLTPGPHDLAVSDGKTSLKRVIEISPAPVLTAFLQSDQNIGTIVVMAGEDGADIYIDGVKYRRQTARGGQLRIQRTPKEYRVRVAKVGFQEVPEQVVQIAKGEEKKVVFRMAALPTAAHLSIQGAMPGAQVFLDQNVVGTVQADGSLAILSIPPGDHVVELRRERTRSQPVRKSFAAGQTVALTPVEVAMKSTTGTLRFNIQPAGAQVTVARAGGQPQTPGGNTMELEEGSYTVTVRAPGHAERSEQVQVTGGQTVPVNISLAREQRKPELAAIGMEGWPPGSWRVEKEWFVRKGGGFVAFKAGGAGTYSFNIMFSGGGGLLRGKELQWVANYKDDRNYILFRLDKSEFRRIQSVNGRRTEMVKKPHGLSIGDYLLATVQMETTPDAVVNRVRKGDQWVVLDTWTQPGANFTQGRFAIRIEGQDEIRMSGFSFHPEE